MAVEFGSPQAADIRAANRQYLLEQARQILGFVPRPVKLRLNYYQLPGDVVGQVADWLERLPAGQRSAGYYDLAQMFTEEQEAYAHSELHHEN